MSPLLTVSLPKGLGQHGGNQSQRQLDPDHPTPEITQYIPIDPGPPSLEQYHPAIPVRVVCPTPLPSLCIYLYTLSHCNPELQEVPDNCPAGNIPLPHNVAGPSRGDLGLAHLRMSVIEDLKKNLASHYLYNPGSRVKDLRTRRSRSGVVKVLILLEVDSDDDM